MRQGVPSVVEQKQRGFLSRSRKPHEHVATLMSRVSDDGEPLDDISLRKSFEADVRCYDESGSLLSNANSCGGG